MNGILESAQLGEFFGQAEQQAISYPREIMLSEGIILLALAAGLVLFLMIALFRRSASAGTAAGLVGMTALMEALAFDRLGFLPDGSSLILQGLFVTTALLFLTTNVRLARENILLGAFLLLSMLAAVALGVTGYLGLLSAEEPMRLVIAATAFFATVLTLHQGFGNDRRAMLVAPGVMLASASILAIIIGGNMGISNWIGAITPHVMLTGGVLMACLLALLPMGADKAKARSDDAPARRQEPAVALAKDEQEMPASLREPTLVADRSVDTEGRKIRRDDETRVEPKITEKPPLPKPVQTESPISALWGKRSETSKNAAGAGVAATALAAGKMFWDWTAKDDGVSSTDETVSLFGVAAKSDLSPENIRGLIDHEDLAQYDDSILGGSDPRTGKFDITTKLNSGAQVRLSGERQVDDDGFLERIVATVEKTGQEVSKKMPADMAQVAAQRAAGSRKQEIAKLKAALANGEIRTYFQPIVRVSDEEIIGFEALARWHQPTGDEPVSADQFINVAVDAGVENDIIRVVVTEAAKELAAWLEAQPDLGQFVSFNVTADSLLNKELIGIVSHAIKSYNLPKGSLVVELTESHVLGDQNKALNVAKGLREAGARLALDDLGAGHSQVGRLGKFPFDLIKTDRSLIASLPGDPQAEKLLGGVVDLARKIGAQIVVEGVETQALAKLLRELNCDFAQGYYYGAPEAAEPVDPDSQNISSNLR